MHTQYNRQSARMLHLLHMCDIPDLIMLKCQEATYFFDGLSCYIEMLLTTDPIGEVCFRCRADENQYLGVRAQWALKP